MVFATSAHDASNQAAKTRVLSEDGQSNIHFGKSTVEDTCQGWGLLEREDTPPNPMMFGRLALVYANHADGEHNPAASRAPTPELRRVFQPKPACRPDRRPRRATSSADKRNQPTSTSASSRGLGNNQVASEPNQSRPGLGPACGSLGSIGEEPDALHSRFPAL